MPDSNARHANRYGDSWRADGDPHGHFYALHRQGHAHTVCRIPNAVPDNGLRHQLPDRFTTRTNEHAGPAVLPLDDQRYADTYTDRYTARHAHTVPAGRVPCALSDTTTRYPVAHEYPGWAYQDACPDSHALPRVDHRDANAHHPHHATDFHAVPAGRMPNADAQALSGRRLLPALPNTSGDIHTDRSEYARRPDEDVRTNANALLCDAHPAARSRRGRTGW